MTATHGSIDSRHHELTEALTDDTIDSLHHRLTEALTDDSGGPGAVLLSRGGCPRRGGASFAVIY